MREIDNRLNTPLEDHIFNLVQQQRKDHRNKYVQQELAHRDYNGVDEDLRNILHLEHVLKIFQPHKF